MNGYCSLRYAVCHFPHIFPTHPLASLLFEWRAGGQMTPHYLAAASATLAVPTSLPPASASCVIWLPGGGGSSCASSVTGPRLCTQTGGRIMHVRCRAVNTRGEPSGHAWGRMPRCVVAGPLTSPAIFHTWLPLGASFAAGHGHSQTRRTCP